MSYFETRHVLSKNFLGNFKKYLFHYLVTLFVKLAVAVHFKGSVKERKKVSKKEREKGDLI